MSIKKIIILIFVSLVTLVLAFILFGNIIKEQIQSISLASIINTQLFTKDKPKITVGETEIYVDIASTREEKAKGLSGRKNLGENEGMLFIFENKSRPSFWMKDMLIPIDIIWITDNKIVGIEKNVPNPQLTTPDSQLKLYSPHEGIDYVLEVNAGFSEMHAIETGNTVDLSEAIKTTKI